MVITGLERIGKGLPKELIGKRIGVLCHAPSITAQFKHIIDIIYDSPLCNLGAIFGPQHGLWGQTQDNMIEWEGSYNNRYKVNVYSLYGNRRKPTREMLSGLDCLLIDLQDIGARPYTYVWTMRLCMEAAGESGIPVFVLDRPNPIAAIDYDGPVLKEQYYTFVGMASIPLCHRMTIGEIAIWIKEIEKVRCDLKVIEMIGWDRNMMYNDTGLPWVIPSPNMPALSTASVYPGMVLAEALNLSEGRGTTLPFELFGAPWLKADKLMKYISNPGIEGCSFRTHNYIPTFHKFSNELCNGVQIHVTDITRFRPVRTALAIYEAIIKTSDGNFHFNEPPYEYENYLIPFDILSGDDSSRKCLSSGGDIGFEIERWREETDVFEILFNAIRLY